MTDLNKANAKAAATYDAASDLFDHPANSFWDRFGRHTVNKLDLKPGAWVLDVCCGSGASALPAAELVGDSGHVIGIDLAEKLLQLARTKAKSRCLENVEFRSGDMLNTGFDDRKFDAVICVFGIFFVPDISAAIRELWRVLRPGGKLEITTWGSDLFEPANTLFWNAVRDVRADLYKGFNSWDRISKPSTLRAIFTEAGVTDLEIWDEPGTHPVASPEEWWTMRLGSGYRGTIEQLEPAQIDYIRQASYEFIKNAQIHQMQTNVIYAISERKT